MGAVTRRFHLTKASTSAGPRRIVLSVLDAHCRDAGVRRPRLGGHRDLQRLRRAADLDRSGRCHPGDLRPLRGAGWGIRGSDSTRDSAAERRRRSRSPPAPRSRSTSAVRDSSLAEASTAAAAAPRPRRERLGGGGGGASDIRIGGTALYRSCAHRGRRRGSRGLRVSLDQQRQEAAGVESPVSPGSARVIAPPAAAAEGERGSEGEHATPSATAGGLGVGGVGGVDKSRKPAAVAVAAAAGMAVAAASKAAAAAARATDLPAPPLQTGVHGGDGLVTVTYTATIDPLIQSVEDLNLPPNLRQSAAEAERREAERLPRACNQLAAFIAGSRPKAATRSPAATPISDRTGPGRAPVGGLRRGPSSCAGQKATIVGTGRADTLRGRRATT